MKTFREFLNESPEDFNHPRHKFTQETAFRKTVPTGEFFIKIEDIDFYFSDKPLNYIIDGVKNGVIVLTGKISTADKVRYFDTLWKDKSLDSSVIDSMFFNILIPKFKVFYSGTLQTVGSKAMWKRIGSSAKQFGVYDSRTNNHNIISINDMDKYSNSQRYQFYVK